MWLEADKSLGYLSLSSSMIFRWWRCSWSSWWRVFTTLDVSSWLAPSLNKGGRPNICSSCGRVQIDSENNAYSEVTITFFHSPAVSNVDYLRHWTWLDCRIHPGRSHSWYFLIQSPSRSVETIFLVMHTTEYVRIATPRGRVHGRVHACLVCSVR